VLTKTRWLLLKRRENLSDEQQTRLAELLRYNLKSVRAYLLKEQFQLFWNYASPLLGRPASSMPGVLRPCARRSSR